MAPQLNIQIRSTFTLQDIEQVCSTLAASNPSAITIWLPRDLGAQLFKDCRLVALIVTCSRRAKLTVRDWIQDREWDPEAARNRFGSYVEGLASLTYAERIGNASREVVPVDPKSLMWAVLGRKGILERDALRSAPISGPLVK